MEIQGIGLFNECYLPILDGVSLTLKNYALWRITFKSWGVS